MTSALDLLLAEHGLVTLPADPQPRAGRPGAADICALGTLAANMAHYGFAPSKALADRLIAAGAADRAAFWSHAEPILAELTGDDRDMDAHVVYKNFPREVLDMDRARYWISQVFMYLGAPNDLFAEEVETRAPLDEALVLTVLDIADLRAVDALLGALVEQKASWRPRDEAAMREVLRAAPGLHFSRYGHRANAARLAAWALQSRVPVDIRTNSATDVLRIVGGLSTISGGDLDALDVSLAEPPHLPRLGRPRRRFLVSLLKDCTDLEGDFARRPEIWKRLLSRLHPGEFDAPRLSVAYDALYNGLPDRFNARLERAFEARDPAALAILAEEPGTFMRQLHRAYAAFGRAAFEAFDGVMDALSTHQLLKLKGYLSTVEGRRSFLVRPRGDWAKSQIVANTKAPIHPADRDALMQRISRRIGARLDTALPGLGVARGRGLDRVKLLSNGQDLAPYGRGTVLDIPEDATFVRSASFWANPSERNTWFDNGWNFYGEDWKPLATCCWNMERAGESRSSYAIFSGDPTNSKDLEGRGCQMIDLYLDRMAAAGVRYAVWSILCFSHVAFSDANEVLATLQWGEKPQSGKLYEPARAQMVFPLTSRAMTKFVAYLDVAERRLVYMDADLPGGVHSATANLDRLGDLMPAFVEHAASLPSIEDLVRSGTGRIDTCRPRRRRDRDRRAGLGLRAPPRGEPRRATRHRGPAGRDRRGHRPAARRLTGAPRPPRGTRGRRPPHPRARGGGFPAGTPSRHHRPEIFRMTDQTHDKWDIRFLEMAHLVSTWSKDPSTRVGCVLVDSQRIVRGLGYNGFPRGVCDHDERLSDRARKYHFVQHAEPNAITNASGNTAGCTAYVTHHPCAQCTGLLIQAGIRRIVTHAPEGGLLERFAESFEASREMIAEAGVETVLIEPAALHAAA